MRLRAPRFRRYKVASSIALAEKNKEQFSKIQNQITSAEKKILNLKMNLNLNLKEKKEIINDKQPITKNYYPKSLILPKLKENRIFGNVIENHKSQPFYKNLDGFKLLLTSYGYVWLFYLFYFMAIGFLTHYFPELDTDRYKQTTLVEMLKNKPVKLLVSAVILAPIVEELMFRSLIKTDHWQLLLFIGSWLAFLFMMIPLEISFWPLRILLVAAVIIASFYILQEIIPKQKTVNIVSFLNKYPITVTVITSILFGFAHVYNYVDSFLVNSALIILVFPRIILGSIAAWLKIKTGVLLWPILLHFLNNAVAVGIMLLSYYYFKY